MTWSGSSRSWEKTELTMLSCSPTVNDAGTLNSRTVVALSNSGGSIMRSRVQRSRRSRLSGRPVVESASAVRGDGPAYVKLVAMNSIQIADETFVAADPIDVGTAVARPGELAAMVARPAADGGRGPRRGRSPLDGHRSADRAPWRSGWRRCARLDGVILHYFLHAEPSGAAAWELAKMNLAKMNHRRRVAGKKMAFEVKRDARGRRVRSGCRGWRDPAATRCGPIVSTGAIPMTGE